MENLKLEKTERLFVVPNCIMFNPLKAWRVSVGDVWNHEKRYITQGMSKSEANKVVKTFNKQIN